MHDQLNIFYDYEKKRKKIMFQNNVLFNFLVQAIPVNCINGKSPFPRTGDFQEQHLPCPTRGYTAVNSRSKTPPQTGPAWDFSVNGTVPL